MTPRGKRVRRVELGRAEEIMTATLWESGIVTYNINKTRGGRLCNMNLHNFETWLGNWRFDGWYTVTIT